MASAHHCDSGLCDRIHISPYIKDQRRIVDLFELVRIGGIVQADDSNSRCGDASHFVMRQLHRLAGTDRLRRNGLNAGGFELGQRGLENVVHTSEMLDQPPRSGGTEARGQGKRQPLHSAAFAGFRSYSQSFRHCITSTSADSRTLYIREKRCQGHMTHSSVKIEHRPHETPSYFRDFLP